MKKFTLKSAALDGWGLFIEEANVGELEKWLGESKRGTKLLVGDGLI